jgi:hypothetical protein
MQEAHKQDLQCEVLTQHSVGFNKTAHSQQFYKLPVYYLQVKWCEQNNAVI